MLKAILDRRRKIGRYDKVTVLLAVNICVLFGLLKFEHGKKHIKGLFLLILFAHYINFQSFMTLIWQLKTAESEKLRERVRPYYYTMNVFYIICLVLSFNEYFGPYCSANKLYPRVMNFQAGLFLVNMCYHHYLHKKNYWLKWEENPGRDMS